MDTIESFNFNDIYTNYYKRCFLFAKSYVHDDMVAEDIASEALIKLWEMSKTEAIHKPRVVLFVIIKHKALDYLKHELVKQNALATLKESGLRELDIRISTLEASSPENIFSADIQRIIEDTVIKLPEQTKQVFRMYHMENISKQEIAEKYNISIKGVDYHISKALLGLRKNLKDYLTISIIIILLLF